MTAYPKEFASAAFWMVLTFAVVAVWLLVQGYWMRWAHRRLDAMKQDIAGMADEIKALRKQQEDLERNLMEIEQRNPFTPWLRKVKE